VKHFDEAFWVDLARNLVSPRTKAAMQRHIETGCKKCQEQLATWQGIFSIAKQETAFTPPSDVVRVVKTQFGAVVPQATGFVRLLFDSNLQPVTAGLRGSVSTRQFLYETDELFIDLRLEPRKEVDRVSLVGQILNRSKKDRVPRGLPVRLQKGKLPVTHTATNQHGEFELEFDAGNDLSLAIGREEEHPIVLPLCGVHSE
jgi:hypothetical protein